MSPRRRSSRRGGSIGLENMAGWLFADLLLVMFLVGVGAEITQVVTRRAKAQTDTRGSQATVDGPESGDPEHPGRHRRSTGFRLRHPPARRRRRSGRRSARGRGRSEGGTRCDGDPIRARTGRRSWAAALEAVADQVDRDAGDLLGDCRRSPSGRVTGVRAKVEMEMYLFSERPRQPKSRTEMGT